MRLADQIQKPTPRVHSWYYQLSDPQPQIEKVRNTKHWDYYMLVSQPTPQRKDWITQLRACYPEGKETLVECTKAREQKLVVFEVDNPPPAQ